MTRLEAHGWFAVMGDRSFVADAELLEDPCFPAIATALADASGWLDDATSDDDLRAAAVQGAALCAGGVVEGEEIADAANDVIREVMEWAEQQGAKPCSLDS